MRGKGVTIGARGTSGIASLISGMTLRERRALHESVKRRILSEAEASTATSMLRAGVYDDKDDSYDGYDLFIPDDGGYSWILRKFKDGGLILIESLPGGNPVLDKASNKLLYWFRSDGTKSNLASRKFKKVTYKSILAALKGKSESNGRDIESFLNNPEDYFEKQKTGSAATGGDASSAAPAPAQAPAAPAAPTAAPAPSDKSPTGARLMKGDIEVFRKTDSGWKATLRLTLPQILSIIKPEYQPEVKEDLTALGDRDELPITRGYLKNPGMSFTGGGLTFQRDGELFADPVAVPGDKLADIVKNLVLTYDVAKARSGDAAGGTTSGGSTWAVGNVIFEKVSEEQMTITVRDDGSGTYADFNSIFGAGANVPRLIQSAAKKNKGKVDLIKIPLKFADESSLMKRFNVKVFDVFGGENILDAGKIIFRQSGGDFVCTLTGKKRIEAAVEILGEMSSSGRASSFGGETQEQSAEIAQPSVQASSPAPEAERSSSPDKDSDKSAEKLFGVKRKLESLEPGAKLYNVTGDGDKSYFAERILDSGRSNKTFIGISEIRSETLLRLLNTARKAEAEKIISGRETGSLLTSIDDYVPNSGLVGSGPKSLLAFDYDSARRVFKDVTQYTTEDMVKFIRICKREGINTMIEPRSR